VWAKKVGVDKLPTLPSLFAKFTVPRRNKDPASECSVKNGLVIYQFVVIVKLERSCQEIFNFRRKAVTSTCQAQRWGIVVPHTTAIEQWTTCKHRRI
jgi:hypothetical protein